MMAGWAELDEEAWQTFVDLHRLLLRLAGRFPDELITHARTMLGKSDLAYLPDTVAGSAAQLGISLTAAEITLLQQVLAAVDGIEAEPAASDQITISTTTPTTDHHFVPAPPDLLETAGARIPASLDLTSGPPADLADLAEELTDLTDHLLIDALTEHDSVIAIRRAWRLRPNQTPAKGRRVYLIEVAPHVRAWELTLEAHRELIEMDEDFPQVEVYWTADDLPSYHQTAHANSTLLWKQPSL